MPKVPNLDLPDKKFGKWIPDKQEVHNMRYWKAKKAKVKPVKRKKKPIDKKIWDYSESKTIKFLKDL